MRLQVHPVLGVVSTPEAYIGPLADVLSQTIATIQAIHVPFLLVGHRRTSC
jgi:hypothetical protein